MRRDLSRSSRPAGLHHRPFSADFIINTRGFEFSVQTREFGSGDGFECDCVRHHAVSARWEIPSGTRYCPELAGNAAVNLGIERPVMGPIWMQLALALISHCDLELQRVRLPRAPDLTSRQIPKRRNAAKSHRQNAA
jgi:hypothetical protein